MHLKNLFFREFWGNKKVLITGHNGFKGSWLSLLLTSLGAEIYGISLENKDPNSLYNTLHFWNGKNEEVIDIRNFEKINNAIKNISPDIIFHLAAQPLVRESYLNPVDTWSTNVMGTISILEAARSLKRKTIFIGITTDKVYQNKEWIYGYRENDRLGGNDPYSSSKAASELAMHSWKKSFASNTKLIISSARAGNVIGGGDYAKDRIIPDIIRSYKNDNILNLRNPNSTRPWQHVLEPLSGYLLLGQLLFQNKKEYAKPWNFGPSLSSNITVRELVDIVKKHWKHIEVEYESPKNEETKHLILDSSKAYNKLKWQPVWGIDSTINYTIEWYKNYYEKEIVKTEEQIDIFTQDAVKNKIIWT